MSDLNKLQPKTARVVIHRGWFSDKVKIMISFGNKQELEICTINTGISIPHAITIAQEMADAIKLL